MPSKLVRYQESDHYHFLTFSCHGRLPYLSSPTARNLFEDALERTRKKYNFLVIAYVVMPEHVHLLLAEPPQGKVEDAVKSIKLSVSLRSKQKPFWMPRYHDRNIFTAKAYSATIRYIHRNPVKRGLAETPDGWNWSSFQHYGDGSSGKV